MGVTGMYRLGVNVRTEIKIGVGEIISKEPSTCMVYTMYMIYVKFLHYYMFPE